MNVIIINSQGGNVKSLKNALDKLGISSVISCDKTVISNADFIILPGQGHFGSIMADLQKKGLVSLLQNAAQTKPFLGICVGMQLLLEASEEAKGTPGLEIIPGTSKRLPANVTTPHMGWNTVSFAKDSKFADLEGDYYFANSYYCEPTDKSPVKGWYDYGMQYPAVFEKENMLAVQFHPEKSGELGLQLLKKSMELHS